MWPFRKRIREGAFLAAIGQLERSVDQLREDHEALKGQHASLRGRVYALWGKEPADPAATSTAATRSPTSPQSRDELRRQLVSSGRFVPGKPPVHQE